MKLWHYPKKIWQFPLFVIGWCLFWLLIPFWWGMSRYAWKGDAAFVMIHIEAVFLNPWLLWDE